MKTLDGKAAFGEMGAAANVVEDSRHPFMHRPDNIYESEPTSGGESRPMFYRRFREPARTSASGKT